ncbi:hypothetical protein GQS40_09450|uniref:NAD(P)/FAD-dependent oxidoreductase n=1 Tax=Leuconostoc lactis TaxID=1246 RepID=A0A6L7A792_LEULA|nr:hypothetical protein [Leuconostoc lactis]
MLDDAGHIVGASVIAAEAEEVINYFVTAINERRTLAETQANLYAYPSLGSEFAKLVPTGNHEGRYVAQAIAGLTTAPITYPAIPVVVFGTQHIAQVGLSVEAGLANGYRVTDIDMSQVIVTLTDGTQFETGRVFVTAGRVANADQLQLENAGVVWDTTEIPVDDHLRTSNPHIYAIGDVGGSPVPIGMEFANITQAAGAHTRIVTAGPTALRAFDQTLVRQLITDMQETGISWYFNATVQQIEKTPTDRLLRAAFVNADTVTVGDTGDRVKALDWVIATGQRPKTLTFPGAELTQDSEAFLNLPVMPDDVTFIGAG